ncbi:MAG: SDR family NAD(P)-dependent oxidoreductase, partial [Gemmatimonadota bacterium]|nr:SDR family NAD(P)-dependent oxidoreductase [Gemmatimonadota bacterium]
NNAGAHHAGPLHTRTAGHAEEVVQTNLTASIDLTRRLLPSMLLRRAGHFVHVASLAGKVPLPYFSIYTATKYGLVGFNHALQIELRGRAFTRQSCVLARCRARGCGREPDVASTQHWERRHRSRWRARSSARSSTNARSKS